jgi:hypothetical protein
MCASARTRPLDEQAGGIVAFFVGQPTVAVKIVIVIIITKSNAHTLLGVNFKVNISYMTLSLQYVPLHHCSHDFARGRPAWLHHNNKE